jgi:hypothetical protein
MARLYGWQLQTSQSSCYDILLAWLVDNHTSMVFQKSWFKPDRADLEYFRSSSERKNIVGSNFKWLGPNTAPGIATSYPSPKSSFSGQYEKTISGSHSCEWKLHSILTFFAWYEISKSNDPVQVQIVFKWWNLDSGINSFQVTFFFAKMTHF